MQVRFVTVRLTIAHLNHRAGDDRDDNLKALCQWCHLHYDKLHHRETRASRKDAARPKSGRSMRALLLSRSKTRSSSYLVDSQAAVQQKSVAMMLAKWRELIDLRASIKAAETPGG